MHFYIFLINMLKNYSWIRISKIEKEIYTIHQAYSKPLEISDMSKDILQVHSQISYVFICQISHSSL